MNPLFALTLLLAAATVPSEDLETPSYRAQAYFEAGEFDRAIAEYDQLLQRKLTREERAIANYNLGSIFLANGEWQRAITHLEKIDLGADPSPLLTKQLYKNQIVACIKGAQQTMKQEGDFKAHVQEAQALLQKGFLRWEKAVEAAHELAVVEGVQTLQGELSLPEDLMAIHQALKEEVAILHRMQEEHQRKGRTLVEAYRLLTDHLKSSLQTLEENEKKPLDHLHKKRLMQMHAAKQRAKSSDWILQPTEESHTTLLKVAKQYFETSLDELSSCQIGTGHVNQAKSSYLLSMLQRLEQKQDPCEGLLSDKLLLCEKRASQLSVSREMQSAFQEEVLYLQQQAQQLCGQVESTLKEKSPTEVESNVQSKMLLNLHAALSQPPVLDALEAVQQSGYELAQYRQIFLPEEQVLLTLCQEMSRPFSPEQKSSMNLPWTMRALRDKFAARGEVTQVDVERQKLADITETLQLGLDEIHDKRQTLSLLEGVLRHWRPLKWLEMKLEQLNDQENHLLLENDLTTPAITDLQRRHEQLIDNCQDADMLKEHQKEIVLIQSILKRSGTELRFCEKQLSRDNRSVATICLEEAQHGTLRSIHRLRKDREKTAPEMLQEGIAEQQRALKTNQRLKPFIKYREDEKELALLPWFGLEDALTSVSTFTQAVQGCEEAKEVLSQVLELYQQGCKEALLAEEFLTKDGPDWLQAAEQQKLSIKHWQEALDLLKTPQPQQNDQSSQNSSNGSQGDPTPSPSTEQQQESSEETAEEAPKQELNGDNSPSRIFELLQEMEQEDEEAKEQKPTQKQGLRPW